MDITGDRREEVITLSQGAIVYYENRTPGRFPKRGNSGKLKYRWAGH
jgi:hypothetical protein